MPDSPSPSPVSGSQPLLPKYREWQHLREHGQWTGAVPSWAKDPMGKLSEAIAAQAVIEELNLCLQAQALTQVGWLSVQHGTHRFDPGYAGEPKDPAYRWDAVYTLAP
jgi:hypothetical protein